MSFELHDKLIMANIDQNIISCICTKFAKMWEISWTYKKCANITLTNKLGQPNEKILRSALASQVNRPRQTDHEQTNREPTVSSQ